jgi:hypothetical protein
MLGSFLLPAPITAKGAIEGRVLSPSRWSHQQRRLEWGLVNPTTGSIVALITVHALPLFSLVLVSVFLASRFTLDHDPALTEIFDA